MEAQINPNVIQERAEALAAPVEKPVEPVVVKPVEPVAPVEKPVEPVVEKVEPVKVPNDPAELRKWNTKISQENAALRDDIKGLKTAIEKLSKKPVDYKELAKNPDSIKAQIEAERAEAIAEMQDQLQVATTRAISQETTVERIRREQDTANYPEWKRVFPIVQNLAANTDGRVNFNRKPGEVLDELYALAVQMAPAAAPVAPVVTPVTPVVPGKTADEIAADIAAAEKRGFEKAQQSIRDEQAGAGLGSAGKGARRQNGTSKEALQNMPLSDLKKLISKE